MNDVVKVMAAAAVALTALAATPAGSVGQAREGPWMVHIRAMEAAMARKNMRAATRARDEAYLAALASPGWEGMLAVGDASVQLGAASGSRGALESDARRAYLAAFFRARQKSSLEGVLGTAEAFSRLGDREVVRDCVQVAERLAAHSTDPRARDYLQAVLERLAGRNHAVPETQTLRMRP